MWNAKKINYQNEGIFCFKNRVIGILCYNQIAILTYNQSQRIYNRSHSGLNTEIGLP